MEEGLMCHRSDADAWKHFDQMYPNFAEELRNVRLGLCTNGFALHGQYDHTYSYWPVIITPCNLLLGMCMSSEYIFLRMVIPSPSNLKRLIDVYLELLIKELLQLWHVGVRTYDHATDNDFIMLVAFIRTVNDLPVYGMASGWSTTGLWDVRFVGMTQGHSICTTVGRRATLTATDSFSLSNIPAEGTRKPSRRIVSRIRLHVRG
ncbi:UNVERIFIED_CONTAM: hypothetical protein Slati_2700100 [Sesamum latifolium]|uniref:Uncharacterized protein n=1 Tax=Sesamum latifolium TaxID=2727402 RepID=A0AAW2VX80_9LAMI